jgi:hypothetical protein
MLLEIAHILVNYHTLAFWKERPQTLSQKSMIENMLLPSRIQ